MKIVITGSLGNISKPLTELLVKKGHAVTVISRQAEKQKEIEGIGAKVAIGTIEDVDFLTETFKGTDIVYLMEPPINFFDFNADTEAYWTDIAQTYSKAVQQSGVQKVVHLSSIGAHTDKNNGMLATHYAVESILRQPAG